MYRKMPDAYSVNLYFPNSFHQWKVPVSTESSDINKGGTDFPLLLCTLCRHLHLCKVSIKHYQIRIVPVCHPLLYSFAQGYTAQSARQ